MMAVSLSDVLEIEHRDDDQLELAVGFPEGVGIPLDEKDRAWCIPADQSNLVICALDQLRIALGKPHAGASLRLLKRIPAMAGLGGGSADAAAALVLGILLWTTRMEIDPLIAIASDLGSDINFFLESHQHGTWLARCTGRGERIERLNCPIPLHFVIVHPPRGCSTKDVFEAFGANPQPKLENTPDQIIRSLRTGDVNAIGEALLNRLENSAVQTTTWIERTRKRIDRYDHLGQCMSGSGSARFCLCTSREEAEKIAIEIQSEGEMRAYCAQSWQSPGIEEQLVAIRNRPKVG